MLLQGFRPRRVLLLLLLFRSELADPRLKALEQGNPIEQLAQVRVAVLQELEQRTQVCLELVHNDEPFIPALLLEEAAGALQAIVQLLLLHEAEAGTEQLALLWLVLL